LGGYLFLVATGFRFEYARESRTLTVEELAGPVVVEDGSLVLPVDFLLERVLGGFATGGKEEDDVSDTP